MRKKHISEEKKLYLGSKSQKGGALPFAAAAAIPFLKASLLFIGKAALAGGVGFGGSKLLNIMFGGGRRKRKIRKKDVIYYE